MTGMSGSSALNVVAILCHHDRRLCASIIVVHLEIALREKMDEQTTGTCNAEQQITIRQNPAQFLLHWIAGLADKSKQSLIQ